MPKFKSASLSDLLDGTQDIPDATKPKESTSEISRDHWDKRRLRQKCNGCDKQIHLVFRQKHCRMCGKVFCQQCSRFQRRLADDASPNPDGKLYQVCQLCFKDGGDLAVVCVKSWTQDFFNMRSAAHAGIFSGMEPELKLVCEIPKVCQPISDMFLVDISKRNQLNARLQNALKIAKRQTFCSFCNKDLFVPTDRKQCVVCGKICCRACSSKDLVVFYPQGAVHQSDEGRARPDMDVIQTGTDISKMAEVWRNYRVCNKCEKHVGREMRVFHFNLELQSKHHEMIDIKKQIVTILDRESTSNGHVGTLRLSSSMGMLDDKTRLRHDARPLISRDGPATRPLVEKRQQVQKLLDRYYKRYEEVLGLKPVTRTQTRLKQRIISASKSFYDEGRRCNRDRFPSHSSSASTTSDGD